VPLDSTFKGFKLTQQEKFTKMKIFLQSQIRPLKTIKSLKKFVDGWIDNFKWFALKKQAKMLFYSPQIGMQR
jgi:hypothetical protein